MISGSVDGNLDELLELLGDRLRRDVDEEMARLADEVAAIVVEGNKAGILAGLDARGRPFAPPAPKTLQDNRRGRGPVLAPRGEYSRTVANLTAKVQVIDDRRFKVSVGYGAFGEVIKFFESGTKNMPARPVLGIRPADEAEIQRVLDAAARRIAERFG